jgi:hypothetical protein
MGSYKRKRTARGRKTRKVKKFYFIGGTGTDKCMFVGFGGGLGNQLYIYAAALTVKNKLNLPLCLLPFKANTHSDKDYAKILYTRGTEVSAEDVKARMNISKKILEKVREPHNMWVNGNIDGNATKNAILAGAFFQNYSSIISVIPTIREDFAKAFKERYPDLTIDSEHSAFMHIRRGDYGGVSLPAEFYNKGLPLFEPRAEIKNLYIISDDIKWCKEQKWTTTKNVIFFEEPDELKTMYLMSLCLAGALISASTFSSWGAILGADQNPNSIIIYPADWITGPSSRIQFPKRWTAI